MKETILLIPGFGETTDEKSYIELINTYLDNFDVVTHNPKWNHAIAADWLSELQLTLNKIEVSKTTVIAFSMGAYIVLVAAQTNSFKKIILCSIAPFFSEQLPLLPKLAENVLGIKRMNDFTTRIIPDKILSPAIFLFGADDWNVGVTEAQKLTKKYGGIFELVPNTGHELTGKYLNKIITLL